MSFKLPDPKPEKLVRSPLTLVVCQVSHEQIDVGDPNLAAAIRDEVKDRYPTLEQQVAQFAVSGGQADPALLSPPTLGWKLRSPDSSWNLVISPRFYSLETTRYQDWSDFRQRLEQVSQAVVDTAHPALAQRIGLRFINRITHPEVKNVVDWRPLIDSSFLGLIAHDKLGDLVTSSQQVLQLSFDDELFVIIRHGVFREPGVPGEEAYLVDQDCYVHPGENFSIKHVMDSAEKLHMLVLQIFQQAMTPKLYQYLLEG
jgi:uncharacterized protein (TIGR04255 family)